MLRGGIGGDCFQSAGQIGKGLLVCCLIGPSLIIAGVSVFAASFADLRMEQISRYNAAVSAWNTGWGLDRQFEGLNFTASVGTSGTVTKAILGGVAPEGVRDAPHRDEETFSTVVNPWYYTTDSTSGSSLLNPQTWSSATTSTVTLSVDQRLRGADVNVANLRFKTIVGVDTEYRWYVSRSSSESSSSIDCRNPNYNYPGSRFADVQTCNEWCEASGGIWAGDASCYADESVVARTGCCTVYWVASEVCISVSPSSNPLNTGQYELRSDAKEGEKSGIGCVASRGTYDSTRRYHVADFSDDPYDIGELTGSFYRVPVLYRRYDSTSASLQQYDGSRFTVSVRLSDDPWSTASDITDGCSSCTGDKSPPYQQGTNTLQSCNLNDSGAQCFGWTPAQVRAAAFVLIVLGALFCMIPVGFVYCVLKQSRKNRAPAQTSRSTTYAVTTTTHHAQPAPVVMGSLQPAPAGLVIAQPVMAQPVVAQPVVAAPVPVPVPVPAAGGAVYQQQRQKY